MSTQGWKGKDVQSESKQVVSKNKNSAWLRSGGKAEHFAKTVASKDTKANTSDFSVESIREYIQQQELENQGKDDAASTSTATTAAATTVTTSTITSEGVARINRHDSDTLHHSSEIPFSDKYGNELSAEERDVIARKRGICIECGVKTHGVTFLRRTPLSNKDVFQGICVRCNLSKVPPDIFSDWHQKNRQRIPSTHKVRFQDRRRSAPTSGRKLERTRSSPVRRPQGKAPHKRLQRHSSDGNFGSQNSPRLTKIMKHLSSEDFASFLDELKKMGSESSSTIVAGLKFFRKQVSNKQVSDPSTIVLENDSWVSVIRSKMESTDEEVIIQCLLIFLTMSTLKGSYRRSMAKKGAIKATYLVLDSVHADGRAREVACAFLNSMKFHETRFKPNEDTIRKLGDIFASKDSTSGRDYALQTLYHIANQSNAANEKDKNRLDIVRDVLTDAKRISVIIEIIANDMTHERTLETALRLLWRFSLPTEKQCFYVSPSERLVQAVNASMLQDRQSLAVLEASCGLLANLAINPSFPTVLTRQAVERVCKVLSRRTVAEDEGFVVCGMHAICNLISDSARRTSIEKSEGQIVGAVIAYLSYFPRQEDIFELGCHIIGYLCLNNRSATELFLAEDGLEYLNSGMQNHVLSRESTPPQELRLVSLRIIQYFSTIERGARKIIDDNLLDSIRAAPSFKSDGVVQVMLESITQNLLATETHSFSPISHSEPSETLKNSKSTIFTTYGRSQSERQLNIDSPTVRAPLSDEAIADLLEVMGRSMKSPEMQAGGCKLLAETYYLLAETNSHFPLTNVDDPEAVEPKAMLVETSQNIIDTIRKAMRSHPNNSQVQNYACCALSNFLAPICDEKIMLVDVQTLALWVNPSLNDVVDALGLNGMHIEVVKSAMHLFWTLSYVCHEGFLKIWTPKVLHQIFESVKRFCTDKDLCTIAFELFMALRSKTGSLQCPGTIQGISAFLAALVCDDEDVVASSSELLVSVLIDQKLSSSSILEICHQIKTVVSCMARYPSCARIQLNVCLVLESLMALEKYVGRELIGESGACQALCDALAIHASKDDLVTHVCRALTRIIPFLHKDTLMTVVSQLGRTLRQVLDISLQNEDVSSSAVAVLQACCNQEEYPQQSLADDSSCMKSFIRSMKYHLGCVDIQLNGCRLISSLCDYDHAKEIIGECGGVTAVINCMLAHADNASVQREGLPALKKLATCAASKSLISREAGETAISYAILIHFRNPRVLSEAFLSLGAILTDFENGTVAPITTEEVSSIIMGMKRFSVDGAVQESACRLLKDCSCLLSNLEIMKKRRSELFPLLFRAAKSFPHHCRDPVSTIVTIMAAEFPSVTKMELLNISRFGNDDRDISETLDHLDRTEPYLEKHCVEVLGGERDATVNIVGYDHVVREEPIYLRCNCESASHVAYQKLGYPDRVDPRFVVKRIEGALTGHILVLSVLHKKDETDSYEYPKTNELVVIKKFPLDDKWENGDIGGMSPMREASTLQMLRGKVDGIVRCREILKDESSIYLVFDVPGLEAYGHRTLQEQLPPTNWNLINSFEKDSINENDVKPFFKQIADQVQSLHSAGFCHGKLCPNSVLDMGPHGLYLDDFTCAYVVPLDSASTALSFQQPRHCYEGQKGAYAPPEIFHSQEFHGLAADIWSLGAILFALLTRSELCTTPDETDRGYSLFILSGGLLDDTANDLMLKKLLRESSNEGRNSLWLAIMGIKQLSRPARELLSSMLQLDPKLRLTLSQVLAHDWLREGVSEGFDKSYPPGSPGADSWKGSGSGEHDGATSHGSGGRSGVASGGKKKEKRQGSRSGGRHNQGRNNAKSTENGEEESKDSDGEGDNGKRYPKSEKLGDGPSKGQSNRFDFMTLVQSSPLAYWANGKIHPLSQLNIHEERRILTEAMEDTGAQIKIAFDIATADRLGAFLSKGQGRILHFSGHGHPRYLAIEDGWGEMQCLGVNQLKEWVSLGGDSSGDVKRNGLIFVFVSACHSRSIGQAFIDGGVQHVVCCDADTLRIRDDTVVAFQKSFYRALACGDSLRKAFDRARHEILFSSILPKHELEEEVRKFCLLPSDGNHDVPIFFTQDSPPYSLFNIESNQRSTRIPIPPSLFIGRQVETYRILRALRRARLVRISGKRGIGKKALVKSTCRFIDDRRHILGFDTIVWFPSMVSPADRELNYLFENLFDCAQSIRESDRDMKKIIQRLYDQRVLLVIEANGTEVIQNFLQKLFDHNESVKVILIHSNDDKFVCQSMPCVESNIEVPKVDIESNIVLFCNMCPLVHSMCPLVDNVKHLRDLLLHAYIEKRLWREDIERLVGAGNPSNILRAAKEIREVDFLKLVDIGRRKALDLKFNSRVALLAKQEMVRKEISQAVRKGDFILASDLQYLYDEMERLKREFPDIDSLKGKAKDLRMEIERAIDMGLWELAGKLRLELDKVEASILVEEIALYERSASNEEDDEDLSIEQLETFVKELNSALRVALDESNFPAAKEINEKIRRYEHLKSDKECKESLSSSIHKLEGDLEEAKSKPDLDAAEEIHNKLLEAKCALNDRFGTQSKINVKFLD